MSSDNLHGGHRERVRRRFYKSGTEGMNPHEILELLLFYPIPRVNTNDTAHRLIEKFGNISNVLDADIDSLEDVSGVSQSSAFFLSFIGDVCKKFLTMPVQTVNLGSYDKAKRFFINAFNGISSEIYMLAIVDASMNLLSTSCFSVQDILPEMLDTRKIASVLLKNNAYKVVIAHNHIGRMPVPDENDYIITKMLADSLVQLNISMVDHIICGTGIAFSMRESGAFSFG